MKKSGFTLLIFITLATLPSAFLQSQELAQSKTPAADRTLVLSHAEYLDRVQAIWTAQMIAQYTGSRFEHQPASVLPETPLTRLIHEG